MPSVPSLITRIAEKTLKDPAERVLFIEAMDKAASGVSSLVMLEEKTVLPFETFRVTDFQPEWVRCVDQGTRAGKHQLHEQGAYYCLDFSSVFSASVLREVAIPEPLVIDACAAPGGKSMLAFKQLRPSLLIANEVIGKRTGSLIANFKRCGISPAMVTRLDTQVLADSLESSADVVIVDAPCSGQSLPAKGIEAPGAFHPVSINMNANRQKRIITNAGRMVAPGGYLAYMTCTFDREENEGIVEWFLKRNPGFEAVEVPHLKAFSSSLSSVPCYRLWPFQGLGVGGFTSLLKNMSSETKSSPYLQELPVVWSAE
ncbi:MAG: rsmF [Patescibacteria group bacterium]|nr:rsmF [Patescibacteria group bacterium]